jgi:hypothetical protein
MARKPERQAVPFKPASSTKCFQRVVASLMMRFCRRFSAFT